jgi:hypothetical protein
MLVACRLAGLSALEAYYPGGQKARAMRADATVALVGTRAAALERIGLGLNRGGIPESARF